jgi:hypothetical protein
MYAVDKASLKWKPVIHKYNKHMCGCAYVDLAIFPVVVGRSKFILFHAVNIARFNMSSRKNFLSVLLT